jgi:uncharacterized protein (TIGR02246 family)
MFERYTEKARRVIFFARYEASQYGSPHIESEHLLLGLLREDRRLARQVLPSFPSGVGVLRREIDAEVKRGERISTSVEMPLSEECKRVLQFAAEEASTLHSKYIGTPHLLLGILREDRCLAARLLAKHGAVLGAVREKVAEFALQHGLEQGHPGGPAVLRARPASQSNLGATVEAFLQAWGTRDAKKLASFFAAHGQFWDTRGEMWLTPGQIERGLAAHFASAEPTELAPDVRDVKFVTAEVSAVTLIWKPEAEASQRNASEPRMVLILLDARPGWLVVSAHLTLLQPGRSPHKPNR